MKKETTIKSIFCTTLILAFTAQSSFAVQNYTYTTTTSEQYSASSPIGRFENYSSTGTPITSIPAVYTPNYYQPAPVPVANPTMNYGTPIYSAALNYPNPNCSQTYSVQDIQTPQEFIKTTTTTEQYYDTREKADKVIDRGAKVIGIFAIAGAVVGLILHAL